MGVVYGEARGCGGIVLFFDCLIWSYWYEMLIADYELTYTSVRFSSVVITVKPITFNTRISASVNHCITLHQ